MVHLLASLPDSFDMLVTAMEANSDNVPAMENVTERLLREEQKLKEKGVGGDGKALSAAKGNSEKRQGTCHYCKKPRESAEHSHRLRRSPRVDTLQTMQRNRRRKQVPRRPWWLGMHSLLPQRRTGS